MNWELNQETHHFKMLYNFLSSRIAEKPKYSCSNGHSNSATSHNNLSRQYLSVRTCFHSLVYDAQILHVGRQFKWFF